MLSIKVLYCSTNSSNICLHSLLLSLGIVSENDYDNIINLLLKIDWKNTAYTSDKQIKKIMQEAVYMDEWNWD